MTTLDDMPYNESQLMEALASLTPFEGTGINQDCHHIHGFNSGTSPGSFFKHDHKLSMLQQITARRVLDYMTLRVRFLIHVPYNACMFHVW
jgi:hypothetical protein